MKFVFASEPTEAVAGKFGALANPYATATGRSSPAGSLIYTLKWRCIIQKQCFHDFLLEF